MYTKAREKEFLKSYIGLLNCHLTSMGRPAHLAGINGAVKRGPQKDNFKNSFFPNFLLIYKEKYFFFPETCFAYTISEPKFTV